MPSFDDFELTRFDCIHVSSCTDHMVKQPTVMVVNLAANADNISPVMYLNQASLNDIDTCSESQRKPQVQPQSTKLKTSIRHQPNDESFMSGSSLTLSRN